MDEPVGSDSSQVVAVAQLVEHRIVVPSVVGSIPISHPSFSRSALAPRGLAPLSPLIGASPRYSEIS